MEKRFITRTIRSYLIPVIVFMVVGFAMCYAMAQNARFGQLQYEGSSFVQKVNTFSPCLIGLLIYCLLFATWLPIVAYSYRFSQKKADMYFQSPLKDNYIRRARVLILLAMYAVAFTFIYFLMTTWSYFVIKYGEVNYASTATYTRFDFPYIRIVVAYFVMLAATVLSFGISCLACHFTANAKGAILNVLCMQIIPNACIYVIILLFSRARVDLGSFMANTFCSFSFGSLQALNLAIEFPYYIAEHQMSVFDPSKNGSLLLSIICLVGFVLLGSAGFATLFMKEISGEFAGKTNTKNDVSLYMLHGALLISAIAETVQASTSRIFSFPSIIMFGVSYFVALIIHEGSVRFRKRAWIPMVAIVGVALIVAMTWAFIDPLSSFSIFPMGL